MSGDGSWLAVLIPGDGGGGGGREGVRGQVPSGSPPWWSPSLALVLQPPPPLEVELPISGLEPHLPATLGGVEGKALWCEAATLLTLSLFPPGRPAGGSG